MKKLPILPALGLGLLLAGPAFPDTAPAAPAWTVGTGVNYSTGDYGFTADTEVFSVPVNLGYEGGSWLLRASIPWIQIKGPAANTGGGAPRPNADSASGPGDIYASATYHFGEGLGPANLAFTGRVKFPTADETKGLGTGKTDWYGQLDFYRSFGRCTPFGSVGYRILGASALYPLQDGVFASAGSHIRVSPSTVWTVAANWGRRVVAGGDDSAEVMLALTHDLGARWQLGGYLLKGFTDASPDHGAGLQVSCRF